MYIFGRNRPNKETIPSSQRGDILDVLIVAREEPEAAVRVTRQRVAQWLGQLAQYAELKRVPEQMVTRCQEYFGLSGEVQERVLAVNSIKAVAKMYAEQWEVNRNRMELDLRERRDLIDAQDPDLSITMGLLSPEPTKNTVQVEAVPMPSGKDLAVAGQREACDERGNLIF